MDYRIEKDTLGEVDFEAVIIIARSFSELTNFISILPYYDVDPKKVKFIGNSMNFTFLGSTS